MGDASTFVMISLSGRTGTRTGRFCIHLRVRQSATSPRWLTMRSTFIVSMNTRLSTSRIRASDDPKRNTFGTGLLLPRVLSWWLP